MIVHAVVQATLTPSPSPSVTPLAVAVHAVAAPHVQAAGESLSDTLNRLAVLLQPYVVVIGGSLAVALQAFLNKLPWLQSDIAKVQAFRRRLVAVVLPLLITYIASVATGVNSLGVAPWLFVASQILYSGWQAIKASGAASTATQPLAAEEQPAG